MKYTVNAALTISVHTVVEADSPEEAEDLALNNGVTNLCYHCAGGDPTVEWVTSGELDGEPRDLTVEKS